MESLIKYLSEVFSGLHYLLIFIAFFMLITYLIGYVSKLKYEYDIRVFLKVCVVSAFLAIITPTNLSGILDNAKEKELQELKQENCELRKDNSRMEAIIHEKGLTYLLMALRADDYIKGGRLK